MITAGRDRLHDHVNALSPQPVYNPARLSAGQCAGPSADAEQMGGRHASSAAAAASWNQRKGSVPEPRSALAITAA